MVRIAVLGKGKIGTTIGNKWRAAGWQLQYGVRSPDPSPARGEMEVAGAVAHAEAILFAVPSRAMPDIARRHSKTLNGKILIDATNDLRGARMSRVPELVASVPQAAIYRAFNSLGWEVFETPSFGDHRADRFYCGSDDPMATEIVEELIEAVGLRPIRLGGLEKVDVVDAVVRLYFAVVGEAGYGRHSAFKVLSRQEARPG